MENYPVENVRSSTWKYIYDHYIGYILLTVAISIFLFAFIPIQFLLALDFIIAGSIYSKAYNKIKGQFMEEFGNSIGFAYVRSIEPESVSGRLFKTGHDQTISDVLIGTYQDIPMRIFSLSFTVGSGKNSHTYSYTVFEATYAETMPDILLFSKAEQSAVSDWFSEDETIELEGDFNKYFKLRAPKGREQEAFQIFTPDIMAELIDKAKEVSFEFVGNKLYIYAVKVLGKREDIVSAFRLAEDLMALFNKNIRGIN